MDDKLKLSEISGLMAHGANNLLAVIGGYFDLLRLDKSNASGQMKEALAMATQAATELRSLVSNFTHIVEIKEKRAVLFRQNTDINELVSGVIKKEVKLAAESAGVLLSVKCAGRVLYCEIDKKIVAEALASLIKSVLKCAPVGGEIKATVNSRANNAKIILETEGLRVSAENFRRIFGVEEAAKVNVGAAVSVGLVFCRLAIHAHGGSVRVKRLDDKKSALILTIPRTYRSR